MFTPTTKRGWFQKSLLKICSKRTKKSALHLCAPVIFPAYSPWLAGILIPCIPTNNSAKDGLEIPSLRREARDSLSFPVCLQGFLEKVRYVSWSKTDQQPLLLGKKSGLLCSPLQGCTINPLPLPGGVWAKGHEFGFWPKEVLSCLGRLRWEKVSTQIRLSSLHRQVCCGFSQAEKAVGLCRLGIPARLQGFLREGGQVGGKEQSFTSFFASLSSSPSAPSSTPDFKLRRAGYVSHSDLWDCLDR